MSLLKHFDARLRVAEDAYWQGHLSLAREQAEDVVRDLASLTSRPGVQGAAARQFNPRGHQCAPGCVCRAAVLLLLQCTAELGLGEEAVDGVVTTYYAKAKWLPYRLFRVWIEYHLSRMEYKRACRELIAYIDAHYTTTAAASSGSGSSSGGDAGAALALTPGSLGSMAPEEDSSESEGGSPEQRYVTLIELLLFHCLVPLGAHEEAIAFLRRGRQPKSATGASAALPATYSRDERLSPELKEAWINELRDLQTAGFTHAAAAAKQYLLAAADSHSAQVAPLPSSSPSASFSTELAGLHASTAYTSAAHARGLVSLAQLPPANLPEPGAAALVHEERDEAEDGASEQQRASQEHSEGKGFLSLDASLIPFPSLQPLRPTLSTEFDWAAWAASLGHRAYVALHHHAPRLANVLRMLCHFAWSRRRLWAGLLGAYVCLRLLAALLRFFRLARLPGVRLLVTELRNFVRIAFISGTGQSLFG